MVMINRATKEVTIKVVYYGPGLSGKTTNLEYIYHSANPKSKGKLLSVSTQVDRTLFFDFLPMELGTLRGMRLRVQLYTVPGQVFYDASRRVVLKGSDGVVFVADSQRAMMDANLESVANFKKNLLLNNLDPETIPLAMQFNKQDLPDLTPVEELKEALNWRNVPCYPSVATVGRGINETLKKVIELVVRDIHKKGASLKSFKQENGPAAPKAPQAVQVRAKEPSPTPKTEQTLPVMPKEAEPPITQDEESPFEDTFARAPIPKVVVPSVSTDTDEDSDKKEEPGGDPILHAGDLYRVLSSEVIIYREAVQETLRKVREFLTTLEDLEERIQDIETRINR